MHRTTQAEKTKTSLIIHDIRSAYNVGSIFRTADAAGVDCLYLTGFTPTPIDRFGRDRKDIQKSALGAEKTVHWEQKTRVIALIKKLKKEGFFVVAVEQASHARDYKTIKINHPIVFIFGNEVSGLSQKILNECDIIAEIPMSGKKESLNVSVAAGIALFRILNI